jgi:hypothetical protein
MSCAGRKTKGADVLVRYLTHRSVWIRDGIQFPAGAKLGHTTSLTQPPLQRLREVLSSWQSDGSVKLSIHIHLVLTWSQVYIEGKGAAGPFRPGPWPEGQRYYYLFLKKYNRSGLGQSPVADSCEQGNGPSGSLKCWGNF